MGELITFFQPFYMLNILCAVIIVFVERKKPQSAVAWLLVMLFLPLIGVIVYMFLGRTYTIGNRHFLFEKTLFDKAYQKFLKDQIEVSKARRMQNIDPEASLYADAITMHLNESASVYTQDNALRLFTDISEQYSQMEKDILAAKNTVHMQYFIIKNDSVGMRFIDLLAKKAREGVQVRLLYDAFGAPQTTMTCFRPIIEAGGQVCRYYGKRRTNFVNLNHRNHRKIVVIDGEIAYTGGANLGEEYTGGHARIKPWRDTHLRIKGSSVYMLQIRFLLDWSFSSKERFNFDSPAILSTYFPDSEGEGDAGVQIVSGGPDTKGEPVRNGYVKLINNAKETVFIQTPYFIPDELALESLKIAARSGVDVRIMLPGVPDKSYVYHITLSYVEELLAAGIKVYLYNGFLHAKTIVADGMMASIGTTNFDIRSFSLNFEVNAFIYDQAFCALCDQAFLTDMENAKQINIKEFLGRPLRKKILENIYRLFSSIS